MDKLTILTLIMALFCLVIYATQGVASRLESRQSFERREQDLSEKN